MFYFLLGQHIKHIMLNGSLDEQWYFKPYSQVLKILKAHAASGPFALDTVS